MKVVALSLFFASLSLRAVSAKLDNEEQMISLVMETEDEVEQGTYSEERKLESYPNYYYDNYHYGYGGYGYGGFGGYPYGGYGGYGGYYGHGGYGVYRRELYICYLVVVVPCVRLTST